MGGKRWGAAAVAAMLLVTAAGCSSDDSDGADDGRATTTAAAPGATVPSAPEETTTTAAPPPATQEQADFVEEADAICAASNQDLQAQADEVDQADPDQVAAFFRTATGAYVAQIGEVRALGFPPDDAELLEANFAVLEEQFDSIATGGVEPQEVLASEAYTEAAGKLRAYGFTQCVQ